MDADSAARAGLGTVTDGEIGDVELVGGGPPGKSTSGFSVMTTTYGPSFVPQTAPGQSGGVPDGAGN